MGCDWRMVAALTFLAVAGGCSSKPALLPSLPLEPPPAPLPDGVAFDPPAVGTVFDLGIEKLTVVAVDANGYTVKDRWGRSETWAAGLFPRAQPADMAKVAALWPLQAGKAASFTEAAPDGGRHEVRVLPQEQITVPAGQYAAIKIEDRVTRSGADRSAITTMTTWYAPAAHAVVKRQVRQSSGRPYPAYDFSLVSALPPGVLAPDFVPHGCAGVAFNPAKYSDVSSTPKLATVRLLIGTAGYPVAATVTESSGTPAFDEVTRMDLAGCLFTPGAVAGQPAERPLLHSLDTTATQVATVPLSGGVWRSNALQPALTSAMATQSAPYFARGNSYLAAGKFDSALADFNELIVLLPDSPVGYEHRSIVYQRLHKNDLALADLTTALTLTKVGYYYDKRGLIYSALEQYDLAIADFSEALKQDRNDSTAYANRGMLYYFRGRYGEAAADFVKVWGFDPTQTDYLLWIKLARMRAGLADPEAFQHMVRRATTKTPPDPLFAAFLGDLRPEEVAQAIVGQDGNPRMLRDCRAPFFLGEWLVADDDMADAAPYLRAAIKGCGPDHGFTDFAKAELASQHG